MSNPLSVVYTRSVASTYKRSRLLDLQREISTLEIAPAQEANSEVDVVGNRAYGRPRVEMLFESVIILTKTNSF